MFAKSKNKHLASSSPIGGYKMIRWYEIWIYVYIYIMPFSYEVSILGLVAAWSCHLPCFPKRLPSSKNSYHPEEPFDAARPLERVTSGAQKISRPSEIRKKNLLQLQKTRICFLIFLKCFLCKKTYYSTCFLFFSLRNWRLQKGAVSGSNTFIAHDGSRICWVENIEYRSSTWPFCSTSKFEFCRLDLFKIFSCADVSPLKPAIFKLK